MTGRGMPAGAAARPLFERWTRLVLRRRLVVAAAWLLVLAGSAAASAHFSSSYAVPGTESARASALLAHDFGERPEGTFTVVYRGRPQHARARLEAGARVLRGGRVGAIRSGWGVTYG